MQESSPFPIGTEPIQFKIKIWPNRDTAGGSLKTKDQANFIFIYFLDWIIILLRAYLIWTFPASERRLSFSTNVQSPCLPLLQDSGNDD